MLTLPQAWAKRLAEVRAICRENGERLGTDLREVFYRQLAGEWWEEFCYAADRGQDLPEAVWRSAQRLGQQRGMVGWVSRLRVRNKTAQVPQ